MDGLGLTNDCCVDFKNVLIQQVNEAELKTYLLYFDQNLDNSKKLMDILFNSLVEFVFGLDAINILSEHDIDKFIDACDILYQEKDKDARKEGALGEIILHALLREYLDTIPFTGRIHFINDNGTPAKGYDVIHLMNDCKTLVLGESKMHGPFMNKGALETGIRVPKNGLDRLADDLKNHFTIDYVRTKFLLIEKKTILENAKLKEQIADPVRAKIRDWKNKLRATKKLDEVIDCIYVPLLCTYTCKLYAEYPKITDEFLEAYMREMRELESYFKNKNLKIHDCQNILLMLCPIPDKDQLIEEYHKRIKAGKETT